ncbi:MAG: hypothetical protein JO110_18940, partial [Acetobacteraceae bacterium]|nr:hypothetical protein [Acetobacteraceae bacterium]
MAINLSGGYRSSFGGEGPVFETRRKCGASGSISARASWENRRRGRFSHLSVFDAASYMLISILFACIAGRDAFWGAMRGSLVNPDSYMRLIRLQEILRQQAPLHTVPRDGSGLGTVLHWSHLLDSIVLALACPLVPVFGWHAALYWIAVAFGPLSLG